MKTKVSCEKKIIKQLKEASANDFIEMLYILGIVDIPAEEMAKLIKKAGK